MTINGNNFISVSSDAPYEDSDISINGNLYRRATTEEVLPGYDAWKKEND